MIRLLLLISFVLSVSSKALVDQVDQIMDPEELMNWKLPASQNSSWLEADDWDTWEASQVNTKSFHYYRSGYDENGLVVYVVDFGKFKYRELVTHSREKIEEFHKHFEQFLRRSQVDGAKDDNKGIVVISDYDGFTLKNFASAKGFHYYWT